MSHCNGRGDSLNVGMEAKTHSSESNNGNQKVDWQFSMSMKDDSAVKVSGPHIVTKSSLE